MFKISKLLKKSLPVLFIFLLISCSKDDSVLKDENTDPIVDNTQTGTNDNGTTNGSVFISVWTLSNSNKTIMLPIYNGQNTAYDFTVDWGDNTTSVVTSFDDKDRSHTYADAGEKTVAITGTLKGFNFLENGDSSELLTRITGWGNLHFGFEDGVFWDCKNLTSLPVSGPDLTGITELEFYFYKCASFIGPVKNWDVSNIRVFKNTFSSATLFNDDISGWDVSSATSLYGMFSEASSFNQDISSWDVSNVTEYYSVFSGASSFNQDISSWDVSNAVYMIGMFSSATSFNQDISGWDVSNVQKMSGMFRWNTAFNQDISGWDTSNVYECLNFASESALEPAHMPIKGSCF